MQQRFDHVNYDALDRAKMAFIAASRETAGFAKDFGFIPDERFGTSANIFSLNLAPYLATGAEQLCVTLLPEGLGSADDARPDDLTPLELKRFWHNIGIKTVAALTNDAAASGMQTILISLYVPSCDPEVVLTPEFLDGFLDGFVEGCRTVGCVYFSGETPQLKQKITPGKLDIAGALFGIVPPGQLPINSEELSVGDRIVFIESSGPHENGFTTLRACAADLPQGYRTRLPDGREYWEALNEPSLLYTPFVQALLENGLRPSNIENITGHGWQKLMRADKPLRYVIDRTLPVPPVFSFVEQHLGIPPRDMIKIFNYGVGLAVFVRSEQEADEIVRVAELHGMRAIVAGQVEISDKREVVVKPLDCVLTDEYFILKK